MSADQLRTAAERLRALAEAATGQRWNLHPDNRNEIVSVEQLLGVDAVFGVADTTVTNDAAFIATMDPNVALMLADWLAMEAVDVRHGKEVPYSALALAGYVNRRTHG